MKTQYKQYLTLKNIGLFFGIICLLGIPTWFFFPQKSLHWDYQIETSLPPQFLWSQLEQVFRNSQKISFWPNSIQSIHSSGLKVDGLVHSNYFLMGRSMSKCYQIVQYVPGQLIVLQPLGDSQRYGFTRIEVIPTSKGSTLHWKMDYRFEGTPISVLYFKFFFKTSFFSQLSRSLKNIGI